MKKTLTKIVCLALSASMLSGCTLLKNLLNKLNPSSSSSEQQQELAPIDKTIADYLSGSNLKVPSLASYNLESEVFYYYQYKMFVVSADCEDASNKIANELSQKMTSDTGFVVYNDDDYTVEDYGYMYVDDFNDPTIELDFSSEEGTFMLSLYRYDGTHGALDVSGIDQSWYVDYVRFYGYSVGAFPAEDIKSKIGAPSLLPTPSGDKFCYGYTDAYSDDYGTYPATYSIIKDGNIAQSYSTALTQAGFTITEGENWTLDEDWNVIDYTVYSGYDSAHKYYVETYSLDNFTYINVNKFSDVLSDQLTSNEDWTTAEANTMTQYLGQTLPFFKMGSGYVIGQETSYFGDEYVYITDNYYEDRSSIIISALLGAGFQEDSTTYQGETYYVLDNHVKKIEISISYSNGNQVVAYYSASSYVPATAIALDPTSISIVPGGTYQLNPVLTPANATSEVTYSSNNESVATVDENGLVTIDQNAEEEQTATVTATAETFSATCTFTVVRDSASGVVMNVESLELHPGDTFQLEVDHYLPLGTSDHPDLAYGRSDSPVNSDVTVSENGLVTIDPNASEGSATITVGFYGRICATIPVTITASVTPPPAGDKFTKVTSTDGLVNGSEYLIVYETGNVAFNGGLDTLDAVKNTVAISFEGDGSIAATETLLNATFTYTTGGYLQSHSGYYIGRNADSNGLTTSTTSSADYVNTISFDGSGNVNILGSGGAYLRFNAASDQARFRYYKSTSYSNQKAIQLYVLG